MKVLEAFLTKGRLEAKTKLFLSLL